jgi:hypothetical protein
MAVASPASTVNYGILVRDYEDLKLGTLGEIEAGNKPDWLKLILKYETPQKEVQCPQNYVELVDYETFMVLFEIGHKNHGYGKRYELYKDSERLQVIKKLSLEDEVICTGTNELLRGKLKYKGKTQRSVGYMFGIELNKECRGKGSSTGTFQGVQYFQCEHDCAKFVTAYLINPPTNDRQANEHASQPDSRHLLSTSESNRFGDNANLLKIGERVVWISDDLTPQSHCGTVKWVGELSEEREMGLIVGVEFDEPIGKGTGKFRGRDLFTAKRGHASLVPAIGLVRYSEYFGGSSSSSAKPTVDNIAPVRSPEGSRGIGDRVQVKLASKGTLYGTIRYIGGVKLGNALQERQVFGLEMESTDETWTDGTHGKTRYFTCENKRGFFVPVEICQLVPNVANQTEQQVTDVSDAFASTRIKTFAD